MEGNSCTMLSQHIKSTIESDIRLHYNIPENLCCNLVYLLLKKIVMA